MRMHRYAPLLLALLPALPASAGNPDNGSEVFSSNCENCHGPDGRGLIPGVPDFTRGERLTSPDVQLLESVRGGKGAMPAHDGMLSNQEILDALAYIRTLQR